MQANYEKSQAGSQKAVEEVAGIKSHLAEIEQKMVRRGRSGDTGGEVKSWGETIVGSPEF